MTDTSPLPGDACFCCLCCCCASCRSQGLRGDRDEPRSGPPAARGERTAQPPPPAPGLAPPGSHRPQPRRWAGPDGEACVQSPPPPRCVLRSGRAALQARRSGGCARESPGAAGEGAELRGAPGSGRERFRPALPGSRGPKRGPSSRWQRKSGVCSEGGGWPAPPPCFSMRAAAVSGAGARGAGGSAQC